MKFKVGDIITGINEVKCYDITTDKATMEVVSVDVGNDKIEVKILVHEDVRYRNEVGSTYLVYPEYFELLNRGSYKINNLNSLKEKVLSYPAHIIPKKVVLEMIEEELGR